MAGGIIASGLCVICEQPFTFNPEAVPSVTWPPQSSNREPVCRDCVSVVNQALEAHGRTDRLTILPNSYSIDK